MGSVRLQRMYPGRGLSAADISTRSLTLRLLACLLMSLTYQPHWHARPRLYARPHPCTHPSRTLSFGCGSRRWRACPSLTR